MPLPTAQRLAPAYTLFDRLLALRDRLTRLFRQVANPHRPTRLGLETMEERIVPDGRPLPGPQICTGAGIGHEPVVKAYDAETGDLKFSLTAYAPSFTGGVRVGTADFTGDGIPDVVTAPGPGLVSRIKVFDGTTGAQLTSPVGGFRAFSPSFTGGVHVAAADVDGDGTSDVVAAATLPSGSRVKVFSGVDGSVIANFAVPGAAFADGITVAAADVTGDGQAEVVVGAGPNGNGWVRTYNPLTGMVIASPLGSFQAFGSSFGGGVFVGSDALAGDVDGDNVPDLAVGKGPAYGSQVKVFSGATGEVLHDFQPFGSGVTGGARVALAYVNDDEFADIVVGSGPGTTATVKVFSGLTGEQLAAPMGQYTPFESSTDGVFVAASNDPVFSDITVYYNGSTTIPSLAVGQALKIRAVVSGPTVTPTGSVTLTLRNNLGGTIYTVSAPLVPIAALEAEATFEPLSFTEDTYSVELTYAGDSNYFGTGTDVGFTIYEPGGPANQPIIPCPLPGPIGTPKGGGGATAPGVSAAGVNYRTGSVQVSRSDLSSGGYGTPWGQDWAWTNAPGYSDGTAGGGATQSQAPHLVQVNGDDSVAIIRNAQSALFFDYYDGSYHARYGDMSVLTHSSGEFVVKDGTGQAFTFYDFSGGTPSGRAGKLKSATDAAGNLTEVISWDGSGRPTEVQRVSGAGGSALTESFVSTYVAAGTNAGLLETVTQRTKVGAGSWSTVRSTQYTYHDGTTSVGRARELRTATVKDASGNTIDVSYYRYYMTGSTSRLKYVFGTDSYQRLIAALGTSVDSLTDGQVDDYADKYLEYDGSNRVTKVVDAAAGCSVCSSGQGEFTLSYTENSSFEGLIDPNRWANKTVETLPDGTTNTVYTNASGQVMLAIYTDASSNQWMHYYRYDAAGRTILEAGPSAVTGFSEGNADLVGFSGATATYLDDDDGLVTVYTYADTTTATTSVAGDAIGYLKQVDLKHGETGTAIPQSAQTYIKRTAGGQDFFFPASSTVYRNDNGTGAETTLMAYTWQGSTAQPASITTTLPTVTTAQNGSNSATTVTTVYDEFDRPVWMKDQAGSISYIQYDTVTGVVVKTITDVDTDNSGDFANLPGGWSSPSGLHLITTYEVDSLGRPTKVTSPEGRVDYMVYDDDNHEVRYYSGWNTSTDAPTGPTTVTREDRANGYTETLTMSVAPALNGSDLPTGGESISQLQSLSRSYVNNAGQVTHTDTYFDLSGLTYTTSTSLGTENTNFYRTEYTYDTQGRLNRTETPLRTISRTVYDGQGRVASEWVGTDDTPTTGNWSPTNTAGTNLVKVREYEYDGGGVGDGNVTKVTDYPGGSEAARVTQTWYDWRNRAVATKQGVQDSTTYEDDFSGSSSLGWTYAGTGATWVESGGVLSQTNTADGGVKKAVATGPSWPADQEITAQVRVDSWNPGDWPRAGVGVRTDPVTGNGYNLVFHGTDQVQFADDWVTWGNSYSFDWEVGVWYTFRLRVEGTTLYGKVWASTDPEPAEWQYVQEGWTTHPSGAPALNGGSAGTGNGSNTASFDDVEIRVGGEIGGGVNRPLVYTDYDNLGEVTKTRVYDADDVTPTITAGVPQPLSSSLLRAQTTTSFDELGRPYRTETYSVNPTTGSVGGNTLKSDTWYDARGQVIKTSSPGGLVQKVSYDGAGRATATYLTDGGSDSGYSDADDVTGDTVLEQSETTYDKDGLPLVSLTRMRFHDAVGTGALGSPSSGIGARVSYSGAYYDNGGRLVKSVDVGTNGGTTWTRPATASDGANNRSDTVLVTDYSYAADAVQTVKLTGSPTGGTFTLTFGGQTTSTIAYNASAATVDAALEALGSIGAGNVVVTAAGGGGWQVRFSGSLAGKYQAKFTANGGGLTGGSSPSVAISTVSAGGDTGGAFEVTDPKGLVSRSYSDALGRTTQSIENFVDGAVSDADDKTTVYTYNAAGMTSLTALLTGGGGQTTEWVYGVTQGSGSKLDSNDIVGVTRWPDPTTGTASGSEQETTTVNALGQTLTATDRNGSVHTQTYDVLGRVVSDAVTTLGSGVDGSVRRIETAYDGQGNAYLITSYNADSGGSIVNQVQRQFNGLGQLTREWQAHGGAVNTGTSPSVQYAYSEMAGGANHSRLTSVTYPSGYVLTYNYSAGLNSNVSRLSSLSDGTGTLEAYDYLGYGAVVVRSHSQPGVDLTYVGTPADAGDQYAGLDRFGRVVDQKWVKSSTPTDRFQYGYDRNSNRLYRDNLIDSDFDETYSYDNLNQLTDFARDTHTQEWDYDALGNWDSVTTDGGDSQTRTHNKQNEITGVSGATTPTFDANGNMTQAETGLRYVYDAWNRLVAVKDSPGTTTLKTYSYDGLNRRVTETVSGTTTDLFYSDQWQVLEEKVGSNTTNRYVWSPVYVDAMVLRDRDTDANGTLDERLWVQQDANWNVTALVNGSGTVVERYVYDPFGAVTVYDASYGVRGGGSLYSQTYLWQGRPIDSISATYGFRNREVSWSLGRPIQADMLGFDAGDVNFYRWEGNNVSNRIDPSGLAPSKVVATLVSDVLTGKYGEFVAPFSLKLEKKTDIGGWIIQDVSMSVKLLNGDKDVTKDLLQAPYSISYWEAFEIKANGTAPAGLTDKEKMLYENVFKTVAATYQKDGPNPKPWADAAASIAAGKWNEVNDMLLNTGFPLSPADCKKFTKGVLTYDITAFFVELPALYEGMRAKNDPKATENNKTPAGGLPALIKNDSVESKGMLKWLMDNAKNTGPSSRRTVTVTWDSAGKTTVEVK